MTALPRDASQPEHPKDGSSPLQGLPVEIQMPPLYVLVMLSGCFGTRACLIVMTHRLSWRPSVARIVTVSRT
jgi:hypothetical protein